MYLSVKISRIQDAILSGCVTLQVMQNERGLESEQTPRRIHFVYFFK